MDRSYPEMCFVFLIIKTFGILIYKKKNEMKKDIQAMLLSKFYSFPS